MKSRAGKCLAAVFLFCGLILRPPPTFAEKVDAPAVTAFVSVNLLPMDSDRVSSDQTVLVEGHLIRAIGKSVPIPKNARVIDGHGQAFLLPALADMHTHAESPDDMKVYLANGVTSVLHMGGASSDFMDQRRPLLNAGKRPGPHVYAAFRVDGSPRYGQFIVKTPDEARWIVRLAKTNGYDYIKAYNDLSPESVSRRSLRRGGASTWPSSAMASPGSDWSGNSTRARCWSPTRRSSSTPPSAPKSDTGDPNAAPNPGAHPGGHRLRVARPRLRHG